ncbi:T cell receptor alpha variable 13-1 [Echeneis naucrates]|uniref:T cell receptor alpha variable 13-1 n=1 Tax=Echeneis naucrates TaxID=173247 RepID=UPI003F50AD6F
MSSVMKHNKVIVVISITFNIILVSGSSLSDQVHQKPTDIYIQKGETAKIECSHSINSYDRILWYKQLKNRQLQFLGYMNFINPYPEKELDINININGSASKDQTCTLTIEKLSEKSSAVYFCAARYHSDTPH